MYEFTGKIRYSETDSEGRLSLVSLLDYFQDCSTFHSESLQVGLDYLKEQHMVWVLTSWQIVVNRYPKLCEEVTVGTFPYEFKGCLGSRNFYMKDAAGNFLAYANSLWSLMNVQTGKLVVPTDKMLQAYKLEPRLEMEYAPRKIQVPEIPGDGETAEWKESITVRPHHLDTNHHVNNGQYIRMAMSLLPEHVTVKQLRAEYKRQAYLHDVIRPWVVHTGDSYIISLRNQENQPYVNVEFK